MLYPVCRKFIERLCCFLFKMSADRQQYCRLAIQGQTKSLYKMNAIAKPGIRLCPTDRCAIRKKRFWVLFSKARKVPSSPCYGKQERDCSSTKRKERLFLFQGKEKRMFLLYCDKRNQKHRKGKEASPSLFDPIPFDKWGQSSLSGMRKVCSSCRIDGKQRTIVCLR